MLSSWVLLGTMEKSRDEPAFTHRRVDPGHDRTAGEQGAQGRGEHAVREQDAEVHVSQYSLTPDMGFPGVPRLCRWSGRRWGRGWAAHTTSLRGGTGVHSGTGEVPVTFGSSRGVLSSQLPPYTHQSPPPLGAARTTSEKWTSDQTHAGTEPRCRNGNQPRAKPVPDCEE